MDKLVDLLQHNTITLLVFIQALQMYITSTNDEMRITTFKLLSGVLNKVSSSKLYPKDIEVLMAFLYSKLLDKPVIKYTLSSIYSLISMKYFDNKKTSEVLLKLTENYNPKEHPQSIRLLPLKIVNYILTTFPQDLYSSAELIDCFLHVSQNEKDPNNLLLIFQVLQEISKRLDIEQHIQPLFDTMFRYYPISFKSSNEAQESQIASLKDSLNCSLSSNDLYASELFPNLIDKYNSATLSQVKLDILATIAYVSNFYSSKTIQDNFLPIWNTLKYTIINQELAQLISIPAVLSYYENSSNESDQIFHSALVAMKNLSTKLNYDSKLLVFDDLSKNLIISERNRKFLQSYLALAIISLPNSQIMKVENNDDKDDEILKKTLAVLFSTEQSLEQIRNKRMALVTLSYFTSNSKFLSQLVPYRDEILTLLQSSLLSSELEVTLRTLAIQSVVNLIMSPLIVDPNTGIEFGLLDDECPILIGKLGELLIANGMKNSTDLNTVIEKELLLALSKLSKTPKRENDIINYVVNTLISQLNLSDTFLSKKCVLLNYLIKIAQTQSLIQIIAVRLINILPNDKLDISENIIPTELIFQALTSLFNLLPASYNTQTITKKFTPILMEFVFDPENEINEHQITYICEIARRLVVGLKNEHSEIIAIEFFNLFANILNMAKVELSIEHQNSLLLQNINTDVLIKHIPILLSIVQGLDMDVHLESRIGFFDLLKNLKCLLTSNTVINKLTRLEMLVGFTAIFNKYLSWDDFTALFSDMSSSSQETEIKIWSIYGLILKCDPTATNEFVKMLNTLDFKQSLKSVAIVFTPIEEVSDKINEPQDQEEINLDKGLNLEINLLCAFKREKEKTITDMVRSKNKLTVRNLVIRNMWKQRILEIFLQNENDNTSNMDYILPLLLTYLPEELYATHLKTLLPNLINTVRSCNDNRVIISVLKIVCNVVIQDSGREILKPYIDTIMELCLKYVDQASNSSREVRKQALRALYGMSLFEVSYIVPYKRKVIKCSDTVLDDPTRSVRMLGVSVRQSWEDLGVDLSL